MTDIKPLSELIEIIPRIKIEDNRGWFLKAITGLEKGLPKYTGEIYVVYSGDGASRGGHYHKKAKEWFTVLAGKVILKLHNINSNEQLSIIFNSSESATVVIPPNIAHRFDTIEKKSFMILAYTDMLYNPTDTIDFNF